MSWFKALHMQISGEFRLFQYLPFEIQLMVFEEALADLFRSRIVIIDTEKVPAYSATHTRHLILGWQLKINNHAELKKENVLELARGLLQVCVAGYYVGSRFLMTHQVWDPPHHSQGLLFHGLSLSSDVFWLPDDLFSFFWTMGFPRAGLNDYRDEERMSYLMVGIEALEEVTRWAMGHFDEQDLEDDANGYVSLNDLMLTLLVIIGHYPSCEEIIVLVGTPRGDREHISWSDLDYISPEDKEMLSKFDLYAADQDEADRCQGLLQTYYAALDDDAPGLSFAFKKRCKPCVSPAHVPQDPVISGNSSGKRSRDDDDDDGDAMRAIKRQKVIQDPVSPGVASSKRSRDNDDDDNSDTMQAVKRQKVLQDPVSPSIASGKRSRDDEIDEDDLPAKKRQRIQLDPDSDGGPSGKRSRDDDEDDDATVTPVTEAASRKRGRDEEDDDVLPAKKRQRI